MKLRSAVISASLQRTVYITCFVDTVWSGTDCKLLEEEDFMHITDYNRLSVLTFLGNAASQISESVLIDIGKDGT